MSVMTTTEKAGYDALVSGAAQAVKKDGSVAFTAAQAGTTATAAASLTIRNDVDLVTVAVAACTTAALPAYTVSGGSAAGSTLTANANGAFPTLDSVATVTAAASGEPVTARFLLHNGASSVDNGVYVLTQQGSGGTPWIAVRYTGLDTAAKIPNSKVRVLGGMQSGGGEYCYTARAAITMGTTRIFYKRIDPNISANEGTRVRDDFAYATAGAVANSNAFANAGLAMVAIGTGTSVSAGTSNSSANIRGTVVAASGTTASGFAGLEGGWIAASTQPDGGDCFVPTQNTGFVLEARVTAPVLSTAAQEFSIQIGFAKQRNASQKIAADFIGFIYDRTSATTSVNWITVASAGGTTTGTINDSGVTVSAGTYNRLRIEKDAGDTNVRFYIDGVLIQTYSSNIPTSQLISAMLMGFKNVGTTSVNMLSVDWVVIDFDIPERRAA